MLDPESPLSLYHQLTRVLIARIRSGEWKVDERMPTERDLCELFGVSRITVRQALEELEREGWIVRRQGKGTFPRTPPIVQRLQSFYSFSEEIRKLGMSPGAELLEFTRCTGPEDARVALRIEPSDELFRIRRLRLADGEPFALETSYVPVSVCPSLSGSMISQSGLYRSIQAVCGIEVAEAEETFEAKTVDRSDADVLHMRHGDAALRLVRTAGTATGRPVEYCISVIRGDRYKYRVTLH